MQNPLVFCVSVAKNCWLCTGIILKMQQVHVYNAVKLHCLLNACKPPITCWAAVRNVSNVNSVIIHELAAGLMPGHDNTDHPCSCVHWALKLLTSHRHRQSKYQILIPFTVFVIIVIWVLIMGKSNLKYWYTILFTTWPLGSVVNFKP